MLEANVRSLGSPRPTPAFNDYVMCWTYNKSLILKKEPTLAANDTRPILWQINRAWVNNKQCCGREIKIQPKRG